MPQFPDSFEVIVLRKPMTLYRCCASRSDDDVLRACLSNYEIDRQPPHPADLHATALRMAVSMFDSTATPKFLAKKRPDRVGSHIAQLELGPGEGVCVARTGSAGHWSVWGVPDVLVDVVVCVERWERW